jgi:hypothetical protein
MKKIKLLIGIVILIIVIVIMLLILVPILKSNQELEFEDQVLNEDVLYIQEESSYKVYSIVSNCIENYISYNVEQQETMLNAISEETSSIEEYDEIYYLKINQIYKIERINDTTYFVSATLDNETVYFVVNIDYINKTYNIRKSDESEFKNAKNNIVSDKYMQSIEIKNNTYNDIDDSDLTDEQIVSKYYYNYLKLVLNKPEIAFDLLDKECKYKRFDNNYDNFKSYIEKNNSKIADSAIISIKTTAEEDGSYTKYSFTDNYENEFIITEYNYTDYLIYIEDKNEMSQEEKDEYLKLSSKEKVEENIKRIFSLLDDKEYEEVYNMLDSDFKNANFATLEKFETYAEETFFDYNVLGSITIAEQGKNYAITVNYKDGYSSAAEKKVMNVVMQLKEETDFVFSFEI